MIRLNVPSQPTIDLLDIAKEYRELWELRNQITSKVGAESAEQKTSR